jgi:hypothetical protein
MSHRKKTSRPDLSSRQAGQCVVAWGDDYNRTSFLSTRAVAMLLISRWAGVLANNSSRHAGLRFKTIVCRLTFPTSRWYLSTLAAILPGALDFDLRQG